MPRPSAVSALFLFALAFPRRGLLALWPLASTLRRRFGTRLDGPSRGWGRRRWCTRFNGPSCRLGRWGSTTGVSGVSTGLAATCVAALPAASLESAVVRLSGRLSARLYSGLSTRLTAKLTAAALKRSRLIAAAVPIAA